jgi:hypothetical protein
VSYAKRVYGTPAERFAVKYVLDPETGCWNWTAGTSGGGYGFLSGKEGRYAAHRLSYELHVGPIPAAHELHHVCENRRCVNPAHLQPVTRLEHARLGRRAQATRCHRGHELTTDNLVAGRKWRTCKRCHRERMYAARHGYVLV